MNHARTLGDTQQRSPRIFPKRKVAEANLGRVSVVMMARAKSATPCFVAARAAVSSGSFETIFSTGKRNADDAGRGGKNFAGVHIPAVWPDSRQTCWQAWIPALPVAQLALPEFTITARTRPRLAASDARPTSRGAATTRFLVNTAAAVVPGQASTSARSGRPLALIPAQAARES